MSGGACPNLDLLERLAGSGLSTLAFSGYTLREIEQQSLGARILRHLDVLVAGRYVRSRHRASGLIGSSNQRIHFLTQRYSPADIATLPDSEVILHVDGTMSLSGIAPRSLW